MLKTCIIFQTIEVTAKSKPKKKYKNLTPKYMLWITLSILTAIAVACRDVFVKAISSRISPIEIMALELFWAIPFLGVTLFYIDIPQVDSVFWFNFIISIPINGLAYYLYLIAITGNAPLSVTLPMLSFTPLFMVVSGAFILEETISIQGGTGIVLIVVGSYFLNITKITEGIWRPLTALIHTPSSRYMIMVAFIFSFAAVIGKKAILHSSPMFFSVSFFLVFNITLLLFLLYTGKVSSSETILKKHKYGLFLGGLLFLHVTLHGLAITISTAAYMIALKRTSILFALLMSWILFREANILSRATGALLMFLGALLLSLLP